MPGAWIFSNPTPEERKRKADRDKKRAEALLAKQAKKKKATAAAEKAEKAAKAAKAKAAKGSR